MNAWEFANSNGLNSIALIIIIWLVLKAIEFCWNRFWRHWNIRKHGYPPPYCDADGDVVECKGCDIDDDEVVDIVRDLDYKIGIYKKALQTYANMDFWKYKGIQDIHSSFEVRPLQDGWVIAEEALKKATIQNPENN
jgi:hypothetical protein